MNSPEINIVEVLEQYLDSNDDESYDSSDVDLFIVSNNKSSQLQSVNAAKKDWYNNGTTSTQSSTGTTGCNMCTSSTQSLLDILKSPAQSSLSRKCVVARNPPHGKQKSWGSSTNDPKSVKPAQRVKEYKDEPFTVSNCKLFCMGCREEICVKKSSIENHVRLSKHRKGKETLN